MSKRKASEDDVEALDDWEELFIAALQGGPPEPCAPKDFVHWCDDVALAALSRIALRRKLVAEGNKI